MKINNKKQVQVKLSLTETESVATAFHIMEKLYELIYDGEVVLDPDLIRIKNKDTDIDCEAEDFSAFFEQFENIMDVFENINDKSVTLILKEEK